MNESFDKKYSICGQIKKIKATPCAKNCETNDKLIVFD